MKLVPFHRSESCDGETCTICDAPAAVKVGEEIMHDDPHQHRHNWTAYVCLRHANRLFFPHLFKREADEDLAAPGQILLNYDEYLALTHELNGLRAAIRWALGEEDEFPPRSAGQGAYWWRTELARRVAAATLTTPK